MEQKAGLKDTLVGTVIGVFMILPGASGATMAVVFGIYERIIHDVSGLAKTIVGDIKFLLFVGIGILVGIVLCSKGLDFLIESHEVPLMFLFATMILVQIPDVYGQTKDEGPITIYNIAALAFGFLLLMAVLLMGLTASGSSSSDAGPILMFFAGLIYVISAITPGISGSTVLLALGLFDVFISAIGNLDIVTLLPAALGAVIGIIAFSKVVSHFLNNNRKSMFFLILGLTAGSVVTVMVNAITGMGSEPQTVECVICAALGLVLGYVISRFSRIYNSGNGS